MQTDPSTPPLVLVVEDDRGVAAMLHRMLTFIGYTVREVGDVVDARDAIEAERPSAVVTDVLMPGGTGLGFLDSLRTANADDLPVLVITGAHNPQVERTVRAYSGTGYLAKPFGLEDLRDALEALLPTAAPRRVL